MTETAASTGKRARRSAAETAHRIVAAATDLFLKQGYAKTNLSQVAASAGVTKPTVYSHFGSKDELLREVTQRNGQLRVERIKSQLIPTDDPRRDLVRFGNALFKVVFSQDARAWDRLAGMESLDHPEVGRAFFAAGPARVIELLTQYMTQQKRAGHLRIDSPKRAAEQMLSLLLGLELLRSRVGQATKTSSQLRRHCRASVELFLNTYGSETIS